MISERLSRLAEKARAEAPTGDRMRRNPAEQREFARIMVEAARAPESAHPLREKARRLELFAAEFPVTVQAGDRIHGSQRFTFPSREMFEEFAGAALPELAIRGNAGHIIPGYPRLLAEGVAGARRRAEAMPEGVEKECFCRGLDAFGRFIRRHGATPESAWVAALADRPPAELREALQLIWFATIFLHAEGCAAAVSLGRFDEYILPFWRGDELANLELLGEFLLKFTEGEESQNLLLAGEEANPVFFAVLRAMRETRSWQPSISAAVSERWTAAQFEAAVALTAAGTGQPAYFGAATVCRALESLGLPEEEVRRDWGIVGCYEASLGGSSYALTTAQGGAVNQWFGEFFSGAAEAATFGELYRGFKAHLAAFARDEFLPLCARRWRELAGQASPFLSCLVDGCIENHRSLEAGGARHNFFGLNLMGLGTAVDSLLAVKTLVFERRQLTLAQFQEAVARDFADEALLLQARALPGKYGSDDAASNALAADLAGHLADCLHAKPRAGPPATTSLGLFWFGADINFEMAATPDGRRGGDPISYGVGPGHFLAHYQPTAILNSALALPNRRCPNGNPLQLRLDAPLAAAVEGRNALTELIADFVRRGGFHLQFNVLSPEEMADAQRHPERHRDLVVRVSGYSALFTGVDRHWQDVLIERARMGI